MGLTPTWDWEGLTSGWRYTKKNYNRDSESEMGLTPTWEWKGLIVFKGPVAWTGKRPETGPNQTNLDRTAVAVAPPFRMDEPPATGPVKTGCNRLEILLQNTFKTHLKTLKMIKI